MTKVNLTKVIKIIGKAGREAGIPLENIKQAVSWAKKNYVDLELEEVTKHMGSIFIRRYEDAIDRVIDSDPLLKDFMKKHPPKVDSKVTTNIAYGSLAAITYHATDWKTYGDYVRTFEREGSLFGLPGSSAEYLDEIDKILGRK